MAVGSTAIGRVRGSVLHTGTAYAPEITSPSPCASENPSQSNDKCIKPRHSNWWPGGGSLARSGQPPIRSVKRIASPSSVGTGVCFFGIGCQHRDLKIGEQHSGRESGAFAAQQRHQHDTPSDLQPYANGAFQAVSGLMPQVFSAATALDYPVPMFKPPTQAIPTQAGLGLRHGIDLAGGQQAPRNGGHANGWIDFTNIAHLCHFLA